MVAIQKVVAETGPASSIVEVLVPGWPGSAQLVARRDGQDVITVEGVRCHSREVWKLVHLRKGRLSLISYLKPPKRGRFSRFMRKARRSLRGSPARMHRPSWGMKILVPPARLATIRVTTLRRRPHRPVWRNKNGR